MKMIHRQVRCATVAALLMSSLCWPAVSTAAGKSDDLREKALAMADTRRNAELFYEVLLGELNASDGDPGTAYALILDAARKTQDPALYKRAADIALQSRSGDSALVATRAWKLALPQDREANRYELQILLALGRIAETAGPLQQELAQSSLLAKTVALATIPPLYARAPDRKLAADVVEQAIASELANPDTAAAAYTAVGRLRLAAGNLPAALEAARRAQDKDPLAEGPALLALETMGPDNPLAEPIVRKYLDTKSPLATVRLAYARALAGNQRYTDAAQQLTIVTQQQPDLADAWLLKASLQMQQDQLQEAEKSRSTTRKNSPTPKAVDVSRPCCCCPSWPRNAKTSLAQKNGSRKLTTPTSCWMYNCAALPCWPAKASWTRPGPPSTPCPPPRQRSGAPRSWQRCNCCATPSSTRLRTTCWPPPRPKTRKMATSSMNKPCWPTRWGAPPTWNACCAA